jgi:hypothetical protein
MKPMTSHERFQRMFAHQEADHPIIDGPGSHHRAPQRGAYPSAERRYYFGLIN